MKTSQCGMAEFSVRNIGGIKEARLSLDGRFIAVTGESGTGKSSLVRALEYLAGKRAQSSSIRCGYEEGEVWGLFREENDPEEKLVGRVLSRNGPNRNYLGEQLVSFARLRDFSEHRIGIQSQFSQLDLLDPRRQREILDSCGGGESVSLRTKLKAAFEEAIRLERELSSIQAKRTEIEKSFQDAETLVESYHRLRMDEGDETQWNEELSSVERFLSRQRKLRETVSRLLGGPSGGGLSDELQQCLNDIVELAPPVEQDQFRPCLEQLLGPLQEMEKLSRLALSDVVLREAEERREHLEKRLGTLRRMKRLAHVDTLEELRSFCEQAEENLAWVRRSGTELESLRNLALEAKRDVSEAALALRERRIQCARDLEKTVTGHLFDLAMESFQFGIDVKDLGKIRPSGADSVDFTLTSGSLSGHIVRVASGGELSRILLALQVSLPDDQLPETLVFDEVEAGLGGRSALLAGFKLRELSSRCQVILVTHEAVIAAQADQHFAVRRSGDLTSVHEVTGRERSAEIARMLSGNPDSPEALEHATVLLRNRPGKLDVLAEGL